MKGGMILLKIILIAVSKQQHLDVKGTAEFKKLLYVDFEKVGSIGFLTKGN
jgi:hypothetical protein